MDRRRARVLCLPGLRLHIRNRRGARALPGLLLPLGEVRNHPVGHFPIWRDWPSSPGISSACTPFIADFRDEWDRRSRTKSVPRQTPCSLAESQPSCPRLIPMPFSDLDLSKRLERAEGYACAQQAEARLRHSSESGAAWMECGGAYAVFDGVDSPCTQTFGLGIFEELTPTTLDTIESFFLDRGAPVFHEVSPFAGVAALALLCERGYRPVEMTSILYQPVAQPASIRTAGHYCPHRRSGRIR